MKWSYLSLLIAGLLPVICAGIAKAGRKDYDNRDPRAWMATQTGYRARANAAQANSLEAFPFFAAGVLLALMAGVDEASIDVACLVFIAARLAYILAYVGDRPSWRSLLWLIGYANVVALFVMAIKAQ